MSPIHDAFDLTDDQLAVLEHRQRVLIPLSECYRPNKAETLAAAHQLGLSYPTVRRLVRAYIITNDPLCFIGKRSGPSPGALCLHHETEQVIRQAIEREFARKQKPHVEAVYRDVCLACTQRGIPAPSLSSFQRRIAATDPLFVTRRRQGRMAAQKLKAAAGRYPEAEYPLHIVQMDHTKADVILVDSTHRKPIGRPFITFALDIYSRCIAGYDISLEAPSATTVGLCLANVAQDKEALLLQHGLAGAWPLSGKPTILHTDNGKDFVSKALKQGCLTHGIRLEQRPPGKPWFGGHIERVIGTFMSKLHDEVPGTTFSNIAERGEYDAEAEACLTLRELEHWLLSQIVQYHNEVHKGIGESPLQRLKQGLTDHTPPQIKDLKSYLIDFLPIMRRRLRRDGFHLDHIAYYDLKLDFYIARRHQYPDGFELRRDPRNLRFVWMRKPDGTGYMELPFRRLTNPDITLWEHQDALRLLRERNTRTIDEHTIFSTILERREAIRKASHTTKKARRKSERLTDKGPLTGSRQPPPSPAPKNERKTPLKPFEVELDW